MSLPDYFNNPNRYKGHYDFYSMFNDCGIEERGGDDVLNTPGTMDTMLTYNTNSKTGPVCGGRAVTNGESFEYKYFPF